LYVPDFILLKFIFISLQVLKEILIKIWDNFKVRINLSPGNIQGEHKNAP